MVEVLPLWLLLDLVCLVSAAKILHLPTNINSHVTTQARLACGLAEQGHHPTILIASNAKVPNLLDQCNVQVIRYTVKGSVPVMNTRNASEFFLRIATSTSMLEKVFIMGEMSVYIQAHFDEYLSEMFESEAVNTYLDEGCDVAIIDNTGVTREILLPFSKGIPVIVFGIQVLHYAFREPALPSFVPNILFTDYTEDMTFLQRLTNTIATNIPYVMSVFKVHKMKEFLPVGKTEMNSWAVISEAVKFYFYLDDIGICYPRPTMPNSIYLGDIMYEEGKTLSSDLMNFVESSPDGVILVSFGSFFDDFPESIGEAFCEAFQQIPQKVIWKLNNKDLCLSENVHAMNWIPQNDLLSHPNVRLFVSHCGKNSILESIYHATPVLGVPLAADQHSNAAMLHYKGLGLRMSLSSFTASEFVTTIEEILTNDTFSTNAQHVSAIMRNKKESAAERASFWINHVIKYGDSHLKTSAFKLNWFQFYMIDVLLTVLLFLVLLTLFAGCIVYLCVRCSIRRVKAKYKTD